MIKDRWFYLGILIIGIFLAIRLIDQSKIMWMFPLDYANDHSAHIAKIHFLAKYGYGNIVPNWWGGFPLLKFYHPGSALFALPLFYIFQSAQIAEFIAMLFIFFFGFISVYFMGKNMNWSVVKRVAFFFFFFGNPLFISYLRVGRFGEMFGFFWATVLFLIIIWYKDHEIDKKFLFFIPVYGILLVSHISVFMVFSSLVFALFLIKSFREKILILISGAISLAWTSFWWLPFYIGIRDTMVGGFYGLQRTLLTSTPYTLGDRLTSFIIPIAFLIIFYFSWKSSNKFRKDWLFYSVPLILCVLFITRIAAFIPFVNRPVPDTYNLYFLFLSLFMLFNLNIDGLSRKFRKIILTGLVILPIIWVLISIQLTAFFPVYGPLEDDLVSILPSVQGSFMSVGSTGRIYSHAVYAYAAIKHDLTTPSGWGAESVPFDHTSRLWQLQDDLTNDRCDEFTEGLDYLGVTDVVAYEDCDKLKECGLTRELKKEYFCLYRNK
ncbi:MAG: hypothetical protein CMH64_00160 [Nanoarchaeota archaeon]|nr:hypothetical protein [Nanoarchaeota archaeon]|tara:strand:+ start:1182 stop:2657 length:1476 start_codon:yes stop_codon:yes gene_type:complete